MSSRGVFAISVVAEMVEVPAQNLRVYERAGLVTPDRTGGGTRRYSPADVERLRRIRELLGEGLNLAGVARVLALEGEVARLEQQTEGLPVVGVHFLDVAESMADMVRSHVFAGLREQRRLELS